MLDWHLPASVGGTLFPDVLNTVAPFLVPFPVWSIETEFRLEPSDAGTALMVERYADEMLTLLSLSIDEDQGHAVFDLDPLLNQIVAAHPKLQSDYRLQRLRKMARTLA